MPDIEANTHTTRNENVLLLHCSQFPNHTRWLHDLSSYKLDLIITQSRSRKTVNTHMCLSKCVSKSLMTKERAVSCSCYSCFYSFKASQKLSITPAGKVCRFAPGEHKALLQDIALGKKRFRPSQDRASLAKMAVCAHSNKPAPGAFKALETYCFGQDSSQQDRQMYQKTHCLGKGWKCTIMQGATQYAGVVSEIKALTLT